jgi:S-adenosylmethionine:diacylglycerol 3-amino-3-carboxypropyl transferase
MKTNSPIAETAWRHGRFDAQPGVHKLLFGRMYEDAAIELEAFRPGGRIFCIASAGCTAMKLSASHEVVAVDINPMQLAYVERRLRGAAIEQGSAERFLEFMRAFTPLLGWSSWRLRVFAQLGDPPEQIVYWRRHFDTRRFRVAVDLLFASRALRVIYSKSFLQSLPANFGPILRRRLQRGIAQHSNRANPYLRALLLADSDEETYYRSNAGRDQIELVHADAADYLEFQPAGSFDGFTLSNILDGANEEYQRRLFTAVKHAAAPGAIAVLRSFTEPAPAIQTNYAYRDRSMIWGIVDVKPVAAL